jgi:hypothetical protein
MRPSKVNVIGLKFLTERRAHPPLGARAEVNHRVRVVVTEKHRNRAAPSGWMVRLDSLGYVFWCDDEFGVDLDMISARKPRSEFFGVLCSESRSKSSLYLLD